MKKIIFLAIALWAFFYYQSSERKVRQFMECGIAAELLENTPAREEIVREFALFMLAENIHLSDRDFFVLKEEIKYDSMKLHQKGAFEQAETLIKAFNSSQCRKLHKQEKIKPL